MINTSFFLGKKMGVGNKKSTHCLYWHKTLHDKKNYNDYSSTFIYNTLLAN